MGSFSALHWIIILGVAVFLLRRFIFTSDATTVVCPTCGSRGAPKSALRGNFAIEVVLWLCFIVPGLIYSVWRATSRHNVCAMCGAEGVIPANSPRGEALAEKFALTKTQNDSPQDMSTESDADKMRRLNITFDGQRYKFDDYRYTNLIDAVTYAERQRN